MKREPEEEIETESSSNEDSEECKVFNENEDVKELVQVDFVFSDPCADQFASVRHLVLSYLPHSTFNPSELSDSILSQISVGTMIRVDKEPDVYGFISAFNISHHLKTTQWMTEVVNYLSKNCPSHYVEELHKVLQSPRCGLLINQRMMNTPYQLIPPLHQALLDDVEWATSNEPNAEKRAVFDFDTFIIICTVQNMSATSKSSKMARIETAQTVSGVFEKFEEEYLAEAAEFSFSVHRTQSLGEQVADRKCHDLIVVIRRQKYESTIKQLKTLMSGSNND